MLANRKPLALAAIGTVTIPWLGPRDDSGKPIQPQNLR